MRKAPRITPEWSPAPLPCLLQRFLANPRHKMLLEKEVPQAERDVGALFEVSSLLPQLERR